MAFDWTFKRLVWLLGMATLLSAETPLNVTINDFQALFYTSKSGLLMYYRLFVPKNYNPNQTYPIMLTLHGAGERGTDNQAQLKYNFAMIWADSSSQAMLPCFVLAPQCPNNSTYGWVNTPWGGGSYSFASVPISDDLEAAVEILDSVCRQYNIDTLREFVSGNSMGGFATWYLLMTFPHRFSAAVPVCGAGDPTQAITFKNIPVWAFHAADDPTVPVSGSRDMINALNAANAIPAPKYTEYPASLAIGHSSWIPAAADTDLVPWVFSQAQKPTALRQTPSNLKAESPTNIAPAPNGLGRWNGEFPQLRKSDH